MTQIQTIDEKKEAFLSLLKLRHLLPVDQVHVDSFKALLDEFVGEITEAPIQESEAEDAN